MFVSFFESWLRVSGFAYRHETIDNFEEMGRRWSIYFEKLIEYVFKDLNENKPSFEVTDNSVAFKINDGLRRGVIVVSECKGTKVLFY